MHRKLSRPVVTIAITTACLGGAQAAQAATVNVPCSANALAAAMNSASSGETLSLAPGCTYRRADLPVVNGDLAITGNGATLKEGGGLEVNSGTLTVTNLNFRKSRIVVHRIGILAVNGGTFTGNTAANGGAIDVDAPVAGAFTVTGATFIRNTATGSGGAIYEYNDFGAGIIDCTFTGNHAGGAGGAILANPNSGTLLSNVVMHGNSATTGGAIYNTARINISGSRISGNHATGQGGGLYSDDVFDDVLRGQVAVTGTVLRGNTAQEGAGIYNVVGTADLTDDTVTGNDASVSGGGIYNSADYRLLPGDMDLTNSQITGNHAGESGGGIYNQGQVAAASTTIARNTATTAGGGIYDDGPVAAVTLTASPVLRNRPDNCEPDSSITDCTR